MTREPHDEPARQVVDGDGKTFSDLFGRFWDTTIGQGETDHQVGVIERELRLAPGDRVLVLPVGAGRIALALAGRGYAVLGIDSCPDAVERCEMLAVRTGSAAEFRCFDLDDPGQWRVGAAVCLGWPGPPDQLATWLGAALTANGRALIDLGVTDGWDAWAEALDEAGIVPLGGCADLWGQDGDKARRAIVAARS